LAGENCEAIGFSVCEFRRSLFALQNNLISWLLAEVQGSQRTVRELTVRVLAGNAAAIINASNVSPMRLLQILQFLNP
jgi:hypothetical protein